MTEHPLRAELAEIDQTLLTAVVTLPPDTLPSEERIRTRAYLLLAHAVLEDRVEKIFLDHFGNARQLIDDGGPIPLELLPFYAAALEWSETIPPAYAKRDWLGFMTSEAALSYVAKVVRKNHGLKEDNVRELAKLVGIEWSVLDDASGVQMASLTTLGAKRGMAGHTSPFHGIDQALAEEEYPANVREWVTQAANTVINLEAVVAALLASKPAEIETMNLDRADK